jgi:hypothetical protein
MKENSSEKEEKTSAEIVKPNLKCWTRLSMFKN